MDESQEENQVIFALESDVRRHVRESRWGGGAKWIEHGLGGTEGLPDLFMPGANGRVAWWMELKLGTIRSGQLSFVVRNAQRREIAGLLALGHCVYVGVGLRGTGQFWTFPASIDGVLGGKIDAERWAEGLPAAFGFL